MARAKGHGNGRLEDAIAVLTQNQAKFITDMAAIRRQMAQTERVNAARFARIEAILLEHTRILQALPDAVRDKIGFKLPEQRQPPRSTRDGHAQAARYRSLASPSWPSLVRDAANSTAGAKWTVCVE